MLRSRRGELSLRVDRFQILAKALRPPPDKHHGLSDVETRYRRRELDLIANEDARRLFIDRARIISAIRAYLDGEGFVEVETPVLQPLYGGALARPFTTHHNALDRDLYLRIATELYLKRLIVGGLERVYELGKDFRNEGLSPKHNPEFTMVELYEAYADYNDAAARLEEIVRAAAAAVDYAGRARLLTSPVAAGDRASSMAMRSRRPASTRAGHADAGATSWLAAIATRSRGDSSCGARPTRAAAGRSWSTTCCPSYVEPTLIQPTFVFDYPVELSPLAREHRVEPGLVERWEAFAGGMEIANAFSELIDPDVQRERFARPAAPRRRSATRRPSPTTSCSCRRSSRACPRRAASGLGIDRLVMLLTGRDSIREVVLFPALRS